MSAELAEVGTLAALAFAGSVVFGVTGFGAALVVMPLATHLVPLPFALALYVLMDLANSARIGLENPRQAVRAEWARLAPAILAGTVAGVTLLVNLPRQATLTAFGIFLIFYGVYSLRAGAAAGRVSRAWAPVSGLVGGTFGTLFGIGAPPYAIYLTRRIEDKIVLRATLSNMVLISTGSRALVFALGGLMLADRLIMFALLLPFALAGVWAGHRLQGRISREGLVRFISALVLLIGASVLWRALGK